MEAYQFDIVHGIEICVEPETLAHPVDLLGLVLGRARLRPIEDENTPVGARHCEDGQLLAYTLDIVLQSEL